MTAPGAKGTAVALKPREALKVKLAGFLPSYGKLLPKGYEPERLVTGALVAVARNPDLLKCTPDSIATALATIAQWGLDIGTTAHLVPYGTVCTPVADYKGYIELMVAAGARKVEAHEVREGDEFDFSLGTDAWLRHRPRGGKEGVITHAYAVVTLRGGVEQFEVMRAEEVDEIRQQKSKQWKQGPLTAWYARKTVIRRVAKYVPKIPRLAAVLNLDEREPVEGTEVEVPTAEQLAALEPKRGEAYVPLRQGGGGYDPETGEVLPQPAAAVGAAPQPEAAAVQEEDEDPAF